MNDLAAPGVTPPDQLAQALRDLRAKDLDARRAAVDVLEALQALPELIETMQDNEHWLVRMAAAQALGRLGDTRAVPFLAQVLHEHYTRDPWFAFDAAVALAQIGTPEALAALRAFRRDQGNASQNSG